MLHLRSVGVGSTLAAGSRQDDVHETPVVLHTAVSASCGKKDHTQNNSPNDDPEVERQPLKKMKMN